jgi:hypothetical protein
VTTTLSHRDDDSLSSGRLSHWDDDEVVGAEVQGGRGPVQEEHFGVLCVWGGGVEDKSEIETRRKGRGVKRKGRIALNRCLFKGRS